MHGTVDSVAAAVNNSSSTVNSKGLASIDSNHEWVRGAARAGEDPAGRQDQQHPYPAGTTATVVIVGKNDRNADSGSPFVRLMHRLREFG